jgi:hypothetical protein
VVREREPESDDQAQGTRRDKRTGSSRAMSGIEIDERVIDLITEA